MSDKVALVTGSSRGIGAATAAALARAGYPILQLKSMDLSLEDIFVKLVEAKRGNTQPRAKTPKKPETGKEEF